MQSNRKVATYIFILLSAVYLSCDDFFGIIRDDEIHEIKNNKYICPNGYDETCKYLTMFKNSPTSIAIVKEKNADDAQTVYDDPIKLFDSDVNSAFKATKTTKIRVDFDNIIFLKRVRVYGNTSYKFNVYYYAHNQETVLIPSLCLTTQSLKNSWNTIWSDDFIKARSILFEIIPGDNTDDGIREIEVWTGRIPDVPKDEIIATLEDVKSIDGFSNDFIKRSSHITKIEASPNVIRFYHHGDKKKIGTARFDLPIDPLLFKRAYLKYRAVDFSTPVSIKRRINNLSWTGGHDVPFPVKYKIPVKDLFEEINPAWLVKGNNTIEFDVSENNKSAEIYDLELIVETDSGWNHVAWSSNPSLYDGDVTTYGDVYPNTYDVEMQFERTIEPEAMMIHLNEAMEYAGTVQYLSSNGWVDVNNKWQIDLSTMKAGWNVVEFPVAIKTEAIRLIFNSKNEITNYNDTIKINEIGICGSPLMNLGSQPRIVVSYPKNGEYFGRTAYIQGFVTPSAQASTAIEGKSISQSVQDNSFSLSLTKDETRFNAQGDDQPWTPVISSVQPTGNNSYELYLYNNVLSTSNGSDGSDNGSGSGGDKYCKSKRMIKVYPDRSATLTLDLVTLKIPAGAVDTEVTITVQALSKAQLAALSPGMINVTYPAAGYRFLVNGNAHYTFKKPILLSFNYNRGLLLNGMSDGSVFMYYYSESDKLWKRLKRTTLADNPSNRKLGIITSETDHFTDIIAGTITVPEQPDPLQYNPNSIKDIKTGDPGSGINLIEPPILNNKGEARLSYPIEVPPGRNGMQPSIAVFYNSLHDNGWMGVGWDIPINSIMIDTKFGVPRYNGTESYILNINNNPLQIVPIGNNIYQLRIESEFFKIIRHGGACNDFWWEVIDKNGTHFIYGKSDNSRLKHYKNPDGTAGNDGNIFMWCIERITDSNNNNIKFEYFHDNITAPEAEPSTSIYLNNIKYTGIGESNGKYSIIFKIDNSTERIDKLINCRGGFKIETRYLLKSIEVLYESNTIRKYNFVYKPGNFNKSILEKFEQYGSTGELFITHTLEYYDDLSQYGSTTCKGFSEGIPVFNEEIYQLPPTGFLSENNRQLGPISGIKADSSFSKFTLAWGHAASREFFCAYTGHYNQESQTMIKFFDIDGDGLSDQVYAENNIIYYRKNLGYNNATIQFDNPREIETLRDIVTSIEHDKGENSVSGFFMIIPQPITLQNPFGLPYIDGNPNSYNNSDSISYFQDVNGDGLVDLITDNIVYYNSLDANGKPLFSLNRPEGFGSDNDKIYVPTKFAQNNNIQDFLNRYNLEDPLLMWEAPFNGTIKITGPIKGVHSLYDELNTLNIWSNRDDGFKFTMQINNQAPIFSRGPEMLYYHSFEDFFHAYGINNSIQVSKGDRIYFRLNSIRNASDCISINPTIEYINNNFNLNITDENDLSVFQYNAYADLLLSDNSSSFIASMEGKLDFKNILKIKDRLSDDIEFNLYNYDSTGNKNVIYSRTISGDDIGDTNIEYNNISVSLNDTLECELRSDTEVDWTSVSNNPVISYSEITGLDTVTDQSGNPLYSYEFPVNIKYYPIKDEDPVEPFVAPKDGRIRILYTTSFLGNLSMPIDYKADVTLAVKKQKELIAKEKKTIENTFTDELTLDHEMDVKEGDKLYFVCASNKNDFEQFLHLGLPMIYYESDNGRDDLGRIQLTNGIDAIAQVYRFRDQEHPFAGGFRSWYFGRWNGNLPNLDSSKMIRVDYDQIGQIDVDNYEEKLAEIEEKMKTFSPMNLRRIQVFKDSNIPSNSHQGDKNILFVGRDNNCFIGKAVLINQYNGTDESLFLLGSTRWMKRVIPYESSPEGYYLSSEYRGANKSTYGTTSSSDFIDMNGDMYPDYLHSGIVQYTKPDGTIEDYTNVNDFQIRSSISKTQSQSNKMLHLYSNSDMTVNGIIGQTKDTIDIDKLFDLIDVNGDGLPDRVYWSYNDRIKVQYNLGYGFTDKKISLGSTTSFSKYQIKNAEVSDFIPYVGLFRGIISWGSIVNEGYETAENNNLYDVNGDGLSDIVVHESGITKVYLNTGNGFSSTASDLYNFEDNPLSFYSGITRGLEILSFGFWGFHGFFVVASHECGATPKAIKATREILDVNGDNLPDIVETDQDGGLVVHINMTGRTNLLKKINNPIGGSFIIDYVRNANTQNNPKSKWTVSKLTVNDGRNNNQDYSYNYNAGVYDRKEREFYGFGNITETRPDGSKVLHKYHVDDYYLNGIEYESELRNDENKPYIKIFSNYETREITDKIKFPYLVRKETAYHEGNENIAKLTVQTYDYDDWGNVKTFTDNGDEGDNDNVKAEIVYDYKNAKYIMNKPSSITVSGGSEDQIYRLKTAAYDDNGNMTSIMQSNGSGGDAVTTINYNANGTISSMIGPQNANGTRVTRTYGYDPFVSTHIASITDGNYTSYASYTAESIRYGKPSSITDIAGSKISYAYDSFGRLIAISLCNDNSDNSCNIVATITYSSVNELPAWSSVVNSAYVIGTNTPSGAPITIETFIDGLKRSFQTKRTANVDGNPEAKVSSGTIKYDSMGRIAEEGQAYQIGKQTSNATKYCYDVLNRIIEIDYPNSTSIVNEYGFDDNKFRTLITDQEGNQKKIFRDIKNNILRVQEQEGSIWITTNYAYNPMGEMTKILDNSEKNPTSITYDNLGRRISIDNKDAGWIEYKYDPVGNISEKTTPILRSQNKHIKYVYNSNNQLVQINYPNSIDVSYQYVANGMPGAGRIKRIDIPGTMWEERTYGKLGELTKSTKGIHVTYPEDGYKTNAIDYTFDTMGRMKSIIFYNNNSTTEKDEKITYYYDEGGLLNRIESDKQESDYISNITYNVFGQRTRVTYGSGAVSTYAYDDQTNRISSLSTQSGGNTIQNIAYKYTNSGRGNNIESITNSVNSVTHTYSYTGSYRLAHADGQCTTSKGSYKYINDFTYSPIGNILSKIQTSTAPASELNPAPSYSYAYEYKSGKPHAVTSTGTDVGDHGYVYDDNGNMKSWSTVNNNTSWMQFDWDEENRLLKTTEGISATDPDKVTQYKYDDAGKRIIKKSDASEVVYVNDNFTVRNSDAISKHIFAGNTRVATVIKTASASDDIFYYHSDHLGSSNVVTNKQGGFNERIEYLPYGETWVQEKAADATNMMPYRFTSKEQDQETGLYYFGARYYDSKLSRWISTDPAVEKYLPEAGKGSDGLPGLGGIFNPVNMNVYQYGGNNPVMFVDPDGRVIYVNGYILPYVSAGDQYGCDYAMGNGGQVARVAVSRGLLIGHGGVDSFPAVTDVTARGNFKIVSTADGWIKRKGYDSTFGGGNFVEISHGKDLKGNEISTRYFHLSSIDSNIKEGALVRKDQSIGYLGNTDNSEWHSHYEIQINGKSIDPRFLNIQGLLFNQNNYFNNYYNFYNNSTYMDYIFGGSNNGGGGFNFYFGGIRNF